MRSLIPLSSTVFLLASGALCAQETTGTLVGNLYDRKSGQPLQGVRILVKSPKLLGERSVVTNATGAYRIPLLPNGVYTITPVKDGYASGSGSAAVTPGSTIRQDFRLEKIGELSQVVEVTASLAKADKTDTTTQSILTQEALGGILNNSNLLAIADISPGVALNSNDNGTTLRVRGGMGAGGKFIVNGIPASDPGYGNFRGDMQMIAEMIETVAVIQSPLNARYGNTESGMVSYVTTRGSNDWKGSIRADYWRATMNQPGFRTNASYRYSPRFGTEPPPVDVTTSDDPPSRTYELSVSGPLWKDHITFAWGGRFAPDVTGSSRVPSPFTDMSQGTRVTNIWDQSCDGVLLPLTGGAQIRRADLYDMGKYFTSKDSSQFNQFSLFFQINPEHSIDVAYSKAWNQHQGLAPGQSAYYYSDLSSGAYGATRDQHEVNNIAYKGLVGTGVLEVRAGRSKDSTIVPKSAGGDVPLAIWYGNRTWNNGGYTDGASGIPGFRGTRGLGGAAEWFPFTNPLEARFGGAATWTNTDGSLLDTRDEVKINTSLLANYQAILGKHMVDVGFDYENVSWDTVRPGPNQIISYMGRISRNLGANDIIYPVGYSGPAVDPAAYAGKWVVYSPHLRFLDVWPGGANSRFVSTNPYNADGTSKYLYQMGWNARSPRMIQYYGPESGKFNQPTLSTYVNDLWTIDNHWSVMAGLRLDRFNLEDDRGSIFSYKVVTPRLDVKWDLDGDQKRILSFTYGQFHNRIPAGVYMSFVHRRQPYQVIKWWEPTVDGLPFDESNPSAHPLKYTGFTAVPSAEFMNPKNYTMVMSANSPDVTKLSSNFRAEVMTEFTVNYQRAWDNGANMRMTLVHRKWKNNYGWFADPHTFTPNNPYAGDVALPLAFTNVLRNDDGLFHSYHGAELEWRFPLTRRVTFAGNATYSRDYHNIDYWSPVQNTRSGNNASNSRPYGTMFPDAWAMFGAGLPAASTYDANTTSNMRLEMDLSRGTLRQSLVLRCNWLAGANYSNNATYAMDVWSDAFGTAAARKPADFYTAGQITNLWGDYYSNAAPGTTSGAFFYGSSYSLTLKYNLEVPLTKKVRWFVSFEVSDPFNRTYTTDQITGDMGYGQFGGNIYVDGSVPNRTFRHNGFMFDPGTLKYRGPDRVMGSRAFGSVECGLRF